MDTAYIPPVMKAISHVFSTTLSLNVDVGQAALSPDPLAKHDVSAIIGFSGEYKGSLVLAFPAEVAERVVALFVGEEIGGEHPDFADAVGELANMVAGNAKVGFEGKRVSISCPSVIMGASHRIKQSKDMPVVQIPAECDCGKFVIEVSLKPEVAATATSTLAQSA